jgi:hypothetical protein
MQQRRRDDGGRIGYPMACKREYGDLVITFADLPAEQFVDPFSEWTIERCRPHVWHERLRLAEQEKLAFTSRRPSGLIFHVARCGSTLVTQMIAECTGVTAYSEPTALNDLLYPQPDGTMPSSIEINALIALLGAHAGRPFVIKCRSWHSLFMMQIVQATYGVPWTFLHRDLVEVAVSVLLKPPTWLRSRALDPNPFQPFSNASAMISDNEYIARMLGSFIASVPLLGGHGTIIAYDTLPKSAIGLAKTFGLPLTSRDRSAMLSRAHFYSKSEDVMAAPFTSDVKAKWNLASPELVAAIREFAVPKLDTLMCATRAAA